MTHLEIVQQAYAAFGSGDLPGLLKLLDPKVVWVNPGPSQIAYFGTHVGRDAVARNVFGFLGEHFQFEVFNPHTFFSNDNQVVVLLHLEANVRGGNERVVQDTVHVFTFAGGSVVKFEDYQNNYALSEALR